MNRRAVVCASACVLLATQGLVGVLVAPSVTALAVQHHATGIYQPIDAAFPLSVTDRHLVDEIGAPFLVQGDYARSLIVRLGLEEVDEYLEARRSQGFNTLYVSLIETHDGEAAQSNDGGMAPFLTPGDFTTPNDAYFDYAYAVLEHAAERGFLVFLAPAYLGRDGSGEGWYDEVMSNGVEVMADFGRYLGDRFNELPNLVWVAGGGRLPSADGLEVVRALSSGIAETAPSHMHAAHWGPESSALAVDFEFLDIDTTSALGPVHVQSLADHSRSSAPRVLIEGESEDGRDEFSDQQIRAQAYSALLTGAVGHFYAHESVSDFEPEWRAALSTSAAREMTLLREFFDALRWWELEPDDSVLGIDGADDPALGDDLTVAASPFMLVAYVPTERSVVIALDQFDLQPPLREGSSPVQGWWFDPTTGETTPLGQWAVEAGSSVTLATPGANAAGLSDWLLVLPLA